MTALTKADYVIGAIDRIAVRRGLCQEGVIALLQSRVGLTKAAAHDLAGHWFSQQFRHGGIAFRRSEYLAANPSNTTGDSNAD